MDTQTQNKKISRLSQTEMPSATLKDAVRLAESLQDNFAGKNASPIDLAKALDRSPTSSSWRYLTGAAVAYGLTDSAYGASSISLTSLGKQIVSPTEEGLERQGLISALLRPKILKLFYEKYDKNKFPKEDIAKNVLDQLGVPKERTSEALKIVIENAKYAGILTDVGGSQYIQIDSAKFAGLTEKSNREIPRGITNGLPTKTSDDREVINIAEGVFKLEMPSELKTRIFNDSETAKDWHTAIKPLIDFAKKQFSEKFTGKKETPAKNAKEV